MSSRLGWTVALVAMMGLGGSAWAREPAAAAPGWAPVFSYWHNWTDDHGVSHMTRCPVRGFDLKSMSPPADPQWQARQPPGESQVLFTVQPDGWKGSWHEDPKVQWIIPLSGTWFVEAMDGTRVELGPGEVSVGEDLNTRPDKQGRMGHLSGNVTPGPVTLMVVQLEEEPTVNQPCRFSGGDVGPGVR